MIRSFRDRRTEDFGGILDEPANDRAKHQIDSFSFAIYVSKARKAGAIRACMRRREFESTAEDYSETNVKIDGKSLIASVHTIRLRGLLLAAAAISLATFVQLPLAMSQEKERSATVDSGETVRIWFGANYGRRCATAGPPVFNLISKPSLGEVTTELADYTVPSGQNCSGRTYTGLRIWYKAGSTAGIDTFKYTIEFPHEPSNPTPSKGPQPVTVSVVVR
jgi:hypothetical protein